MTDRAQRVQDYTRGYRAGLADQFEWLMDILEQHDDIETVKREWRRHRKLKHSKEPTTQRAVKRDGDAKP